MTPNERRIAQADAAIKAHQTSGAISEPRDLLADLMHWCAKNGRNFDHELSMATDFYGEEAT